MTNRGWFKNGHDKRRHKFTRAECSRGGSQPTCHRLTNEHRSLGGKASHVRQMAELRVNMNLPLPSAAVAEKALEMIRNGELEIPL